MRLAIIRRVYAESGGGGAERHARSLCARLAAQGHSLTLFAERCLGAPPPGAELVRVRPRAWLRTSGTAAFAAAARAAMAAAGGAAAFDAVLALSRAWPCDVFRSAEQIHAAWLRRNKPWWQRLNPRHAGILALERRLYSPGGAGLVAAPSGVAKAEIVAHYPYPPRRVRVVWNGVDHAVFRPPADEAERESLRRALLAPFRRGTEMEGGDGRERALLFLFAAGNFAIKGLDAAISAMAASGAGRRAWLLVAGGGEPAPYEARAAAAGLAGRVLFLGRANDMRPLYAAADLLVHPSLGEPFANVCAEAAACGTPSLTTACNGSSEIFRDGGGLVVPADGGTRALAEAMASFLAMGEEERRSLRGAALRASRPLAWEAHASAIAALLAEAAAARRAAARGKA